MKIEGIDSPGAAAAAAADERVHNYFQTMYLPRIIWWPRLHCRPLPQHSRSLILCTERNDCNYEGFVLCYVIVNINVKTNNNNSLENLIILTIVFVI